MSVICASCKSDDLIGLGKRFDICNIEDYARYVSEIERFNRHIYMCNNCGLLFISPMYSTDDENELYSKGGHLIFSIDAAPKQELFTPNIYADILKDWTSKYIALGIPSWKEHFSRSHGRAPKFLDVGCGDGRYLHIFSKFGFDVMGVEMSKHLADHVKNVLKLPVENISFYKIDQADKFDCILASHIIEHVSDPNLFIGLISNILSDDGLLLIETPFVDNPDDKYSRYSAIYHSLFFNHSSLGLLMQRHGFSLHDITYIYWNDQGHSCFHFYPLVAFKRAKDAKEGENLILDMYKAFEDKIYIELFKLSKAESSLSQVLQSRTFRAGRLVTSPYRLLKRLRDIAS